MTGHFLTLPAFSYESLRERERKRERGREREEE
jgi:hypothetical protein